MDLHTAAKEGNLELVRLLVEQGADKDKADRVGCTPLFWGCDRGHIDVVKYLVEQGASLDKADSSGVPPISDAHVEVLSISCATCWSRERTGTRLMKKAELHSTTLLKAVDWRSQCC